MANYYHVYPVNDIIKHSIEIDDAGDSKCPCNPVKNLSAYDYNNAIIMVHSALDGRNNQYDSSENSISNIMDRLKISIKLDDDLMGKVG
jgi:hypothetical protein